MQMVEQTSPKNNQENKEEATKEIAAVDEMMQNAIIPFKEQI